MPDERVRNDLLTCLRTSLRRVTVTFMNFKTLRCITLSWTIATVMMASNHQDDCWPQLPDERPDSNGEADDRRIPQDRGARMRCTLDTNILINMVNRYPRDLFASLWESMEGAVASGEICVCEVILKELERGDDDLAR